MTIMTSGMAHVSGGIMAAYIALGVEAKHLLTAVIMTAPGTSCFENAGAGNRSARNCRQSGTSPIWKHDANALGAHRPRHH